MMRWAMPLVYVLLSGCNSEPNPNGGSDLGELDPRCEALCSEQATDCSDAVSECEQLCQVRIAGVSDLCATCLVEDAQTDCGGSSLCCPNPSFPNTVLDCDSSCATSQGVNPQGDHPVCVKICTSDDAACEDSDAYCLQKCHARIAGVSGLCATCLLDGAYGGECGAGQACCPYLECPTSAEDCAGVCN